MIYLLRNTRRKLLSSNNKVTSYLLYAAGEVFLVVAGILIAFQVEEYSEKIQNKKAAEVYLEQIQSDLLDDILECENYAEYAKDVNTATHAYLNGDTASEHFSSLTPTIMGRYLPFSYNKDGYNNFTTNIEKIPDLYKSIADLLIKTYGRFDVHPSLTEIEKHTTTFHLYMMERMPNYFEIKTHQSEASDAELAQFFENDPTIKNKLWWFNVLFYKNSHLNLVDYKYGCISLYLKINKLLGKEELPDLIDSYVLKPEDETFQNILGHYTKIDDSTLVFDIELEGGYPHLLFRDWDAAPLYLSKDSTLFCSSQSDFKFFAEYDSIYEYDHWYDIESYYVKEKK